MPVPFTPHDTHRPKLTHFLCVPLVNDGPREQLRQSLARIQEDYGSDSATAPAQYVQDAASQRDPSSIPIEAIRPPGTIHLTLGVMALDPAGLHSASALLRSLDLGQLLNDARDVSGEDRQTASPLVTTLHSLTSTSGNMASVLYACPSDPTGSLQRFCESLRNIFVEAGFIRAEDRPLLLHATIVNTIYARKQRTSPSEDPAGARPGRARGGDANAGRERLARGKPRQVKIFAPPLVAKYESHVWASGVVLDRLAICAMGAKTVVDLHQGHDIDAAGSSWKGPDKYYEEIISVPIPVSGSSHR